MANCRVFWGSHGCDLDRGHDGPHVCDCCGCDPHTDGICDDDTICVGAPPYYGPETHFYGEDAEAIATEAGAGGGSGGE